MTLIGLLVVLIIIGVLLWLLNTYLPIDPKIRMIINVIVMIFVVIWLLQAFGLVDSLSHVRIR